MERVAFLIEPPGRHIGCLLNPEDLEVRRRAGLTPRRRGAGLLSASLPLSAGHDDTLLATGGGTTEYDMELLFDVDLADPETRSDDVRDMTWPIWQLAENAKRVDGGRGPTVARFIWGKAWNVPVVVVAASERLQRFTAAGVPQRSWLRLQLRRVDAPAAASPSAAGTPWLPEPAAAAYDGGEVVEVVTTQEGLGRLDLIAAAFFGDPTRWREIAAFNDVDDPHDLEHLRLLRLPPRGGAP